MRPREFICAWLAHGNCNVKIKPKLFMRTFDVNLSEVCCNRSVLMGGLNALTSHLRKLYHCMIIALQVQLQNTLVQAFQRWLNFNVY